MGMSIAFSIIRVQLSKKEIIMKKLTTSLVAVTAAISFGYAASVSANTTPSGTTDVTTQKSSSDTTTGATSGAGSLTNTPEPMGGLETTSGTRSNSRTGTGTTTSPSVLDQSSATSQDVEVTRTLREELNKSSGLSTSAKNVEIVTLDNAITLRGTVASQSEKDQIANAARGVAGTRSIRNEIKVDTSRR